MKRIRPNASPINERARFAAGNHLPYSLKSLQCAARGVAQSRLAAHFTAGDEQNDSVDRIDATNVREPAYAMSTRGAASSASAPDRSGDLPHAARGEPTPGDIAVGVIIGRTSEYFDFFVYAIASVMVFPKLVFPYVDALSGTLLSFAVFAVAFLARPLGTVIFIGVDRAYGRGIKLMIALLLLGVSTVAVAFLPGYDQIGAFSAVLLILFRLGQGLALGGEWDGLATLLALNTPEERRGWTPTCSRRARRPAGCRRGSCP